MKIHFNDYLLSNFEMESFEKFKWREKRKFKNYNSNWLYGCYTTKNISQNFPFKLVFWSFTTAAASIRALKLGHTRKFQKYFCSFFFVQIKLKQSDKFTRKIVLFSPLFPTTKNISTEKKISASSTEKAKRNPALSSSLLGTVDLSLQWRLPREIITLKNSI